jgi:hypothetical protein
MDEMVRLQAGWFNDEVELIMDFFIASATK